MLKCKKVLEELELYRRDKSGCEKAGEIELHLQTCSDCRKALASLEKLDNLMDLYQAEPVKADFHARLQQKIMADQDKVNEDTWRFSINWRKAGMLAAAAVLLFTATIWLINPFGVDDIKNNPSDGWEILVASHETEIIENLDLLEEMETVNAQGYLDSYEIVEALPEVMEIDFNGSH